MCLEVQYSLLAINLRFLFYRDRSSDHKHFSSICRKENLVALFMTIYRVQIGKLFFRSNCDGALQTKIFRRQHCNLGILIINKEKISAFCKTYTLELWHLIFGQRSYKLFLFFFHKISNRFYFICRCYFRLLQLFFLLRLPLFFLLNLIQSNFNDLNF